MIHISATGLSDLLLCEKKFHYRIYNPQEAITTADMLYGKVIHAAIEKHSDKKSAFLWAVENLNFGKFYPLGKGYKDRAEVAIGNYYDIIYPKYLTEGNFLVEQKFYYPITKDIAITGRIDRIQNESVFDWKTGVKAPDAFTLSELQFYMYWLAYRKKFKADPKNIYYGHLHSGELYNINMDEARMDNLKLLLDRAVKMVYNGLEARTTGRHCRDCQFRGICYAEFDDVTAS